MEVELIKFLKRIYEPPSCSKLAKLLISIILSLPPFLSVNVLAILTTIFYVLWSFQPSLKIINRHLCKKIIKRCLISKCCKERIDSLTLLCLFPIKHRKNFCFNIKERKTIEKIERKAKLNLEKRKIRKGSFWQKTKEFHFLAEKNNYSFLSGRELLMVLKAAIIWIACVWKLPINSFPFSIKKIQSSNFEKLPP